MSILLFKVKCCVLVLRVMFHICTPEVRVYCTGVPQSSASVTNVTWIEG